MKTKNLFTIAAALSTCTLAPAQNTDFPQPVKTETATIQSRHLSALQGIPADADMWVAIDVRNSSDVLFKAAPGEVKIPAVLKLIDSVAIGLSDETPAAINHLNTLSYTATRAIFENCLEDWENIANPTTKTTLQQLGDNPAAQKRDEQAFTQQLIAQPLPRLYAAITTKPGCTMLLAGLAETLRARLLEDFRENATPFESEGWYGICFTANNLSQELQATHITPKQAVTLNAKSYYLAYRIHDNKLLIAGAETPDRLCSTADGRASIPMTDKAACLQKIDNGHALAALYVGPDTINALLDSVPQNLQALRDSLGNIFSQIAKADSDMAPTMKAGENALNSLYAELKKLTPAHKTPLSMIIWQNGSVHLQLECDACDSNFTIGEVPNPDWEDAVVYACGSTFTCSTLPDIRTCCTSLQNIATAWFSTLTPEVQSEMTEFRPLTHTLPAFAELIANDGQNALNALDNGWSLRFDFNSTYEKPLYYHGQYLTSFSSPLMALSGSICVNDAELLTRSCNNITYTLSGVLGLFDRSAGRTVTRLADYSHTNSQKAKIFTHNRYKDFPALSLSNHLFTFCSDAARIQETIKRGQPENTVSGFGAIVNLPAWQKTLQQQLQITHRENKYLASQFPGNVDSDYLQQRLQQAERELKDWEQFMNIVNLAGVLVTIENGTLNVNVHLQTPCLE